MIYQTETMKTKSKHVIIYSPDGNVWQYTTNKAMHSGDRINIHLADTINCDPTEVMVAYMEDNKPVGKAFVGMPYVLEMW